MFFQIRLPVRSQFWTLLLWILTIVKLPHNTVSWECLHSTCLEYVLMFVRQFITPDQKERQLELAQARKKRFWEWLKEKAVLQQRSVEDMIRSKVDCNRNFELFFWINNFCIWNNGILKIVILYVVICSSNILTCQQLCVFVVMSKYMHDVTCSEIAKI